MRTHHWNKWGLSIICLSGLVWWALDSRLQVTHYNIPSDKIHSPIRLVYLSDLHGEEFGQDQQVLMDKVQAAQPDLVLLGGDIVDYRFQVQPSYDLVEALVSKYPVYYVTGNHEYQLTPGQEVKNLLRQKGVTVLEGESDTLNIGGSTLRIVGLDDPFVGKDAYHAQLSQLQASDTFTVLLSHRPERMRDFEHLQADLAFAGHAHGGQWRIPILEQGVYAPHQGMWPKYTGGQHRYHGTTWLISRGLSNQSTRIPRLFNRPEMLVVDIIGK